MTVKIFTLFVFSVFCFYSSELCGRDFPRHPLPEQGSVTYKDSHGRYAGKAVRNGDRVTFFDEKGRFAGSANVNGSRVTYKDSRGRHAGSASAVHGRTTYTDSKGRFAGSSR